MNSAQASNLAAEVRAEVLARRRALSASEVEARSRAVCHRFFQVTGLEASRFQGSRIALYQALPSELSLLGLEAELSRSGAQLFFPRIFDRAEREIEFVEIEADQLLRGERAHQAWQEGPYGIQEPHPDLPAIDPLLLEAMVVPGVAFGLQGERIGMGAGFYDRFLSRVPQAIRVVLGFDFQLYERLEQNPWDQPVDLIVTESREVWSPRARFWVNQLRTGQAE